MLVEIKLDELVATYDSEDNTVFFEVNGQCSDAYDKKVAIDMLKQMVRTLESLP
jgi:hypothetical protein